MGYVTPDSTIRFHYGIPLDPSQDHTLYFSTHQQQDSYFSRNVRHVVNDYSYQRVERGRVRTGLKAAQLYNCNYLSFRNTAFGTKWFYAFITAVEYVNNNCTDVFFEIDPLQTWLFEFTVGECMIDREHPVSDRIGEHILPEPVELGEYIYNDYSPVWGSDANLICVMYIDTEDAAANGVVYDGIFSGATMRVFREDDTAGVKAFCDKFLQTPDNILAMYMVPYAFVRNIPDGGFKLPDGRSAQGSSVTLDPVSTSSFIDSYKPRNNKLYTYPYNFLNVDNASGGSLALRYEFFENLTPELSVKGTVFQPVKAILRPRKYKGVEGLETLNIESLSLENYPMCSWNIDSYKAWMAQASLPNLIAAGGATLGVGAATLAASTPVGAVLALLGGVTALGSLAVQGYKASIAADVCRGSTNAANVNFANHQQKFYAGRMSITTQYARMIDEFFDVYGYNTSRLGIPLTHSRPQWNYIQTRRCVLTGSLPAEDAKAVCDIYDRGITYWAHPENVGKYNLDNRP